MSVPGDVEDILAARRVPEVDEKIVQVDLAETLKIIAREGSHAFYHGKIVARIADAMESTGLARWKIWAM